MNKETSINILRRLRDAVRRKCPEKWRTSSSVLLYANGPAHRSVLVKALPATNNVTTPQHPPYSPDPVPVDFYLFPPMKSALKRWSFCDATDIKNATDELKRLSQNGFFQECFQHIYNSWRKSTVVQGDVC